MDSSYETLKETLGSIFYGSADYYLVLDELALVAFFLRSCPIASVDEIETSWRRI